MVSAQTFSLKLETGSNNASHHQIEVYVALSSLGKLGSSNFQFTFEKTKLSTPTLASHQLTSAHYEVSLTQPSSNTVSLNVVLAVDGNGDQILVAPNWFHLATINFEKLSNEAPTLNWLYNGGSTKTVAFLDNNHTQIYATSVVDLQEPIILPVELCCLEATVINEMVSVTWTTLSEKNNSHFNVQRSHNGSDFSNIGKIAGLGTSTISHNYEFIDKAPEVGINYYRLEQVDLDGTSLEHPSIVTANINSIFSTDIKIYPNPVKDELTINLGSYPLPKSIQISNAQGQIIQYIRPEINPIPVSDLPAGVYFLVIDEINYLKWVKL